MYDSVIMQWILMYAGLIVLETIIFSIWHFNDAIYECFAFIEKIQWCKEV